MAGRVIDSLLDGSAPAVIRQKAAVGDLPVPSGEKVEILVLLAQDRDETTRDTAFATLRSINSEELRCVLASPETPPAVLDFAVTFLAHERRDLAAALLENPRLAADLRGLIVEILATLPENPAAGVAAPPAPESPAPLAEVNPAAGAIPASTTAESTATPGGEVKEEKEVKKKTLLEKLACMNPSEKIKAALTGNMEERLVLIRDSNKLVARAVLGSPKLTDQEIENIASMKNVTEEVLRLIAMNRKFMRTYGVVRQLINNPRTPIDVGMSLLHRINDRDMKSLLMNKNIAEIVRSTAIKMIKQKQEANKPKLPHK
jgi:hypothetical protein